MKSKAGPSSRELKTVAETERFLTNDEHSVIGENKLSLSENSRTISPGNELYMSLTYCRKVRYCSVGLPRSKNDSLMLCFLTKLRSPSRPHDSHGFTRCRNETS